MGGCDSEELEGKKEESILSPKAHGDNEQETVSEARARVDQLWRTILATGNNNSERERPTLVLERISAFNMFAS